MKKKLITIIIPHYNGGEIFMEALGRIIDQDYKNKEIVIIDDSNNLNLSKKVMHDNNIRIIKNKKNKGFAESLNIGILNSQGEYVSIILQDCILNSDKWLTEMFKLISRPNGEVVSSRLKNDYDMWEKQNFRIKKLTKNNLKFISSPFNIRGCLIKKEIFKKMGLFDSINFKFAGEDKDMYLRLAGKVNIEYGVMPYVTHKHPYTFKKLIKTKQLYGHSQGRLLRKHGIKSSNLFLINFFPFFSIAKSIFNKTSIKDNIILDYNFTKYFLRGIFSKKYATY